MNRCLYLITNLQLICSIDTITCGTQAGQWVYTIILNCLIYFKIFIVDTPEEEGGPVALLPLRGE
jgi:hypothetical protein